MDWFAKNWIDLFMLIFTVLTFWATFYRKAPEPTHFTIYQKDKEPSYQADAPDSLEFRHDMKVWGIYAADTLQILIATIFILIITNTPEADSDPKTGLYVLLVIFLSFVLHKRLSLWLKYNKNKFK